MLRFIKHNLTGIDGVALYPILSLLIFIMFFIIVIVYVVRMERTRIEELSAAPIEEDTIVDFLED